jgi:hypothetical protein
VNVEGTVTRLDQAMTVVKRIETAPTAALLHRRRLRRRVGGDPAAGVRRPERAPKRPLHSASPTARTRERSPATLS